MKGGPVYGLAILGLIFFFDLLTSILFTAKIGSLSGDFKETYDAFCANDIVKPDAQDTAQCGGENYSAKFSIFNYRADGFSFNANDTSILNPDEACNVCFNFGNVDPQKYQTDAVYREQVSDALKNPPAVSKCRYFCPRGRSDDCWCVRTKPIETLTGFPGLTASDCPAVESLAETCTLPYDDLFKPKDVPVTLASGDQDWILKDKNPSEKVSKLITDIGSGFDRALTAARQRFSAMQSLPADASVDATRGDLAELILALMDAQTEHTTLETYTTPNGATGPSRWNGLWKTETTMPNGGNNVIHIQYEGTELGPSRWDDGKPWKTLPDDDNNKIKTIPQCGNNDFSFTHQIQFHKWRIDVRPHVEGLDAVKYINKTSGWHTGAVRSFDLAYRADNLQAGCSTSAYMLLGSEIRRPVLTGTTVPLAVNQGTCAPTSNSTSNIGLQFSPATSEFAQISFSQPGLQYPKDNYRFNRSQWFNAPSSNISAVTTQWGSVSAQAPFFNSWLPWSTQTNLLRWGSLCEPDPLTFTVDECTASSLPTHNTADFFRCFLRQKWLLREQTLDFPVNSGSYQMQTTISEVADRLTKFNTRVSALPTTGAIGDERTELLKFASNQTESMRTVLGSFLTMKRANELASCTDKSRQDPDDQCYGAPIAGEWAFPGFNPNFNDSFLNTLALASIAFNALSILVLVPLGVFNVRQKLKDRRAKKMKREGGLQQSDVRQLRKQHMRNLENKSVCNSLASVLKGLLVVCTAVLCFVCVVKYTQAATSEVTRLLCASLVDFNTTYHAICGNHVEFSGLGFLSMVAASLTLTFIFVNSVRTKFKEGKEAGRYAIMLSIVLIAAVFIFAFVVKPEMDTNEGENRPLLYGLVEFYPVFAFDIIALILFGFLTFSYCWKNSRHRMSKRKSAREGGGSDARNRWDAATGRTTIVTSDGATTTQQGPLRGPNARSQATLASPGSSANIWDKPQRSKTMPASPSNNDGIAMNQVQLTSMDVSGGSSHTHGKQRHRSGSRRSGSSRNL